MTTSDTGVRAVSSKSLMDDQPNTVESVVARAWLALEERAKIPPEERFDQLVKLGLIDDQGRIRTDNVEEVPISKLFEGRNGNRAVP